MPRHKSINSALVEAIVFIGLLALAGHLSVNFWERFIIQAELTQMKTSLHSLKETLVNIGTAYDSLHTELQELVEIAENKKFPVRFRSIEPKQARFSPTYSLDRRQLKEIQVKSLYQTKGTENEKVAKSNKTTVKYVYMANKAIDVARSNPNKNASTITRYPAKSTGAGSKDAFYKRPNSYSHSRHPRHNCPRIFYEERYNKWEC